MKSLVKIIALFLTTLFVFFIFRSQFTSANAIPAGVINEIAWSGTAASPNDE